MSINQLIVILFKKLTLFIVLSASLTLNTHAKQTDIEDKALRQNALSVFGVIPEKMPRSDADTPALIQLGKKLYFETRLSSNNSQSCNSCHNLLNAGQGHDAKVVSVGALGIKGRRNAPSTWNAGFQFAQNWDARAENLEQQASEPLLSEHEMALASKQEAVDKLNVLYSKEFEHAFARSRPALTFENITKALAAFQRTLITKDRFDRYLNGDNEALTAQEKRGLLQFQENSCASCHSGRLLGGQFTMKMGIVNPYPNRDDRGMGEVTNRKDHDYLFKVPSLRNVANTAPYFHDGAAATLQEAIRLTGWHQLGKKLTEEEVENIAAFLETLNNENTVSFP